MTAHSTIGDQGLPEHRPERKHQSVRILDLPGENGHVVAGHAGTTTDNQE